MTRGRGNPTVWRITCPCCKAKPGEPCRRARGVTKGEKTEVHRPRMQIWTQKQMRVSRASDTRRALDAIAAKAEKCEKQLAYA